MIYELSLFGSVVATLALIAAFFAIWACIRAIAQYVCQREDEREFREYCRRYVEREYASVETIDSLVRRELDEMTKLMERTR
jgi:restriction endonuclease